MTPGNFVGRENPSEIFSRNRVTTQKTINLVCVHFCVFLSGTSKWTRRQLQLRQHPGNRPDKKSELMVRHAPTREDCMQQLQNYTKALAKYQDWRINYEFQPFKMNLIWTNKSAKIFKMIFIYKEKWNKNTHYVLRGGSKNLNVCIVWKCYSYPSFNSNS